MIIISQNKNYVVNSDNVKLFNVYEYGGRWYLCADGIDIARYDTEKEAMDILNEMSAMIIAGNMDYVIE